MISVKGRGESQESQNRQSKVGSLGEEVFLWLAIGILLATALFKIPSLFSSLAIFDELDPILHLSKRWTYLIATVAEFGLVIGLTISTSPVRRLWMVFGFSVLLSAYRAVSTLSGVKEPCACLGQLGAWFPPIQPHIDLMAQLIILLLFSGSGCFLAIRYFARR